MSALFRFTSAVRRDPGVDAWFHGSDDTLRRMAQVWFEHMRDCGGNVRELIHDGHPTACVEDAAFAYVDAFRSHVNVGFYNGAALDDPAGVLEGSGKRMRHIKLRWGAKADEAAINNLITAAYRDVYVRLKNGHEP